MLKFKQFLPASVVAAIPVKSRAIYEIICRVARETYTVIKTGNSNFLPVTF